MQEISILTWLDLSFTLDSHLAEQGSPDWLTGYTVYPDDVDVEVVDGTTGKQVDDFFSQVFGVRYLADRLIALDSAPEIRRWMRLHVNNSDTSHRAAPADSKIIPSFRRMAILPESGAELDYPKSSIAEALPIIAFYSFKGGVGRTTHLLAYLQALSFSKDRRSALIIDADLEAPGLTSLVNHEASVPSAGLSFIDLIALLQNDSSPGCQNSLDLCTYFTRRQVISAAAQEGEARHYFIPAFRSEEQAMRLGIRPEHLAGRPGQRWSLSTFLLQLAKNLNVDVILIDLRAGYSEIASPFLFDPRVRKVIVTTPSIQSVDGTISVLQQLGKIARRAKTSAAADPTIILSFVLAELTGSDFISDTLVRLEQAFPEFSQDESWVSIQPKITPFSQELLYFSSLSEAFTKLGPSLLVRRMSELVDFDLPPKEPELLGEPATIDKIRRSLNTIAEELEYAESGKGDRFLRVTPLRALARQYLDVPPSAVIIGAKGAGKTYTYLQMLRAGSWSGFVKLVSGERPAQLTGLWPLLHSTNLSKLAQDLVDKTVSAAIGDLSIQHHLPFLEISDLLRIALREKDVDETWWRYKWFQIFAASLGLATEPFNAAAAYVIDFLRKSKRQLTLMIDGLEDLFPDLASNQTEQMALRSLLQGVPAYLKSVPDNPLGILIFVRADLARAAIPQNYGQFSRLYEAFSLQWSEEEALRLAVWLSSFAGVRAPEHLSSSPELLSAEEARECLLPVWGRKLGTEKSREARSAEWVIAALSDYKGQIQARDLVRFLQFAAHGSIEGATSDRVLIPSAIRSAIKPCSEKKIEEIGQEIPQLKAIFSKLQSVSDLRIPFDAASADLKSDDVRFLQSVGVVAELDGELYMPEIFRAGLGLRLSEGKRPKVLSFARRFA